MKLSKEKKKSSAKPCTHITTKKKEPKAYIKVKQTYAKCMIGVLEASDRHVTGTDARITYIISKSS